MRPDGHAFRFHWLRRFAGGGLTLLLGVVALVSLRAAPEGLVWLAPVQTLRPPAGTSVATFTFVVENRSASPVEVLQVRPSCGCTTAELPASPWILPAGARSDFRAIVDFAGKHGRLTKTIVVQSTAGAQVLEVTVDLPEPSADDRRRNQEAAAVDRQAVFRGACAACHAVPLAGLKGPGLFAAACGVCHEASPRAAMVPDLKVARTPRDEAYWRTWISRGRAGTLMPGFAASEGGPLTAEQITDLVAYALAELPRGPAAP